jgi:hypothetical protein
VTLEFGTWWAHRRLKAVFWPIYRVEHHTEMLTATTRGVRQAMTTMRYVDPVAFARLNTSDTTPPPARSVEL